MTLIHAERVDDQRAIHRVNKSAFETAAEADLVDSLRSAEIQPIISLVAEHRDRIVGHILFTPVTVKEAGGDWQALALGPMAVAPEMQRSGFGGMLARSGLHACREAGHNVVFVLGHKEYYPRFGFVPTRPLGITCEFDVSEPYFMVTELAPGAIAKRAGVVCYHPLFKTA